MKTWVRLLCVLLLVPYAGLFAQEEALRYSVRGTVRDQETGRPLSEVAVTLPGGRYATVTNMDGTFVIKSNVPPRSIVFSLLGYQTVTRTVPDREDVTGLSVGMRRLAIALDPARVVSGDPLSLMRAAIDKIPVNCPDSPELFDCFYRETAQKRSRFIYISEAVLKVYKSSFKTPFAIDRTAVVKSRLLTSPKPSDTLGVKVVGGPATAVDLDLVKLRQGILDPTQLQYYHLKLLPSEVIDDRMQFVIRMTPAVSPDFAMSSGTVYLDQETLAVTRIFLELDVSDEEKATRAMLVKKPAGLRFKPKEMTLLLDYKREDGKSRLSYLKVLYRFNCDWRKKLWATEFTAVSEMVVTHRHARGEVVPIQRAEAFRSSESLSDKARYFADPDFWKAYNIIEPTLSLEKAVGRLLK